MHLTHLHIRNFLGIRHLDADLAAPAHLFCGHNKVGKSSIRDAVRFALQGEPGRVSLKKDYGQLLTDGAHDGVVEVAADDKGVGRTVADGSRYDLEGLAALTPDDLGPAASVALDAHLFAQAPEADKRGMLMAVTGTRATPETVVRRLEQRGLTGEGYDANIDALLPALRGGFDGACRQAKDAAREAKGAWRQLTGETWGAKKGADWRAPPVDYDPKRTNQLAGERERLQAQVEALRERVGALRERAALADAEPVKPAKAAKNQANEMQAAQQALAEMDASKMRLTAGMQTYREQLAVAERCAGTLACPCCDAGLRLAGEPARLVQAEAAAQDGESLDELRGHMADYREAIEGLDTKMIEARARIETIRAKAGADAGPTQEAVEAARQAAKELAATRAELQSASSELEAVAAMHAAAAEGQRKQAAAAEAEHKAAAVHAGIAQWEALGEALSPAGIPAELLADALAPINDRLRAHAQATGWPQVRIDADMAITADGRPRRLLSESEQWRSDACLAEALSHVAGLRLLILDRLDVLDLAGRGEAVRWIQALAATGDQDSVIAMATLKAPPEGLAGITVHWIEPGCRLSAAA